MERVEGGGVFWPSACACTLIRLQIIVRRFRFLAYNLNFSLGSAGLKPALRMADKVMPAMKLWVLEDKGEGEPFFRELVAFFPAANGKGFNDHFEGPHAASTSAVRQ